MIMMRIDIGLGIDLKQKIIMGLRKIRDRGVYATYLLFD